MSRNSAPSTRLTGPMARGRRAASRALLAGTPLLLVAVAALPAGASVSTHRKSPKLTPGRTYIDCIGSHNETAYRPARCDTLKQAEALAFGLNLAHIQWKSWGGRTARGRGIELGFHLPPDNIAVSVVASGRTHCLINHGKQSVYFYAKLTATSRHGTRSDNTPPPCD